ncbi:MAG TPA: indolepyruvate oxidoreductase subunit beta family protein [Burkholderiaceae bacterium]|nr:indolepyruvate oxidoreductase subunit beta family protein [Burkholderiaceae bacterium]
MTEPIKIAIFAMGGEGGGVLADWIVDLGERDGWVAQTTSVPGVAQRTGSTIYYVELFPRAQAAGQMPVLALMPTPGDVDVVLASELMEAARAVQRGLVTPERTTLIASTSRVYSIKEKSHLGDGLVDPQPLLDGAVAAAKHFVRFDMAQAAEAHGSLISAVLFGALAGTGALPFGREAFEQAIARGGVGVKASLAAFGAGFDASRAPPRAPKAVDAAPAEPPVLAKHPGVAALLQRVASEFPAEAHFILREGVRRVIDYQDLDYGTLYLDRVRGFVRHDPGRDDPRLTQEVARYLALWMSWEDTIRVADLKTRGSRFDRVRKEVRSTDAQVLAINEYMHPRIEEICDTLPAALGSWLLGSGWPRRVVERFTCKGRVIRTSSLPGFLMLYFLASLRPMRRKTLRYRQENAAIEAWLRRVEDTAARGDHDLATEIAECPRLIKGYGDTHERGMRNFTALMQALDRLPAPTAAKRLRTLREAALADEHGNKLREAIAAQVPG